MASLTTDDIRKLSLNPVPGERSEITLGIDLGTTNTCVAIIDKDGKEIIVTNQLGDYTTPSVVSFKANQIIVGKPAFREILSNETNTVYDVKRLIGRKFNDPFVQADIKAWPFTVLNDNNKPMVRIETRGRPRDYWPEQISAYVLNHVKEFSEARLQEDMIIDAVITVPARFNNAQRLATKQAGQIAGLNVLRVISEPTAAALAFGLKKLSQQRKEPLNVLVYDLGGGTFDVSVVKIEEGVFDVLATAGETHLGGADFDSLLVDHFAKEFYRRYKRSLTDNKRAMQKLRNKCERAKRLLAAANEVTLEVSNILEGFDFRSTITRPQFDELCNHLFLDTIKQVKIALHDARLDKSQIDEVLLVGGSTRIPRIQAMLKEFFGKPPNISLNPDHAVAIGAARQAELFQAVANDQKVKVRDVTPLALGVRTAASNMCVIIPHSTQYPVTKSKAFAFPLNSVQDVDIQVVQGLLEVGQIILNEFKLPRVTPDSLGVATVTITFNINENGLLTVTARDDNTHQQETIRVNEEKFCIPEDKFRSMVEENKREQQRIRIERRRKQAANTLEKFIIDMEKKLASNKKIKKEDKKALANRLQDSMHWHDDHTDASEVEIQTYLNELENYLYPRI